MNRAEITKLLREYEEMQSVDEYIIDGIHLWPLLKIAIAYSNYIDELLENKAGYTETGIKNLLVFVNNIVSKTLNYRNSLPLDEEVYDICCLTTPADRRLLIEGKGWYDVYFDPLVDLFPEKKLFSLEIVHGVSAQLPRYRPSYVVDYAMAANSLKAKMATVFMPLPLPEWCDELISFVNSSSLQNISRQWIKKRFFEFKYFSKFFEKIFQKLDFQTLLLVCWYSPVSMAACHAAKKLGRKTADLQHGMQSEEHFGYSGWVKAPAKGYSMMPDYFWVWGNNDKSQLIKNNSGVINESMVLAGGYPMLNLWQTDKEFLKEYRNRSVQLSKGYSKTIIVTLQHLGSNDLEQVKNLVEKGSDSWLWLVRSRYQDTATLNEIEQFFAAYQNVNFSDASCLPLYALFEISDIHITWFSSCAVEALAFGLKSILLHENGRIAFDGYIKNDLMHYSENIDFITKAIDRQMAVPDMTETEGVFASGKWTEETLKVIVPGK